MKKMARPGQLCTWETVCSAMVWWLLERNGTLAEKEVGNGSPPWTPLSFTPRVGPSRTPPPSPQQLLEQVCIFLKPRNPGPALPQDRRVGEEAPPAAEA